MALRDYQIDSVKEVRRLWESCVGGVAVCLVAPTGAGKTRMGEELIAQNHHVVWIAHRHELILQARDRLRERFGHRAVGVIMADEYENREARIQIATIQTLLARKRRPPADVLVLDEAHHYVADEWSLVQSSYEKARVLGLTATPERADGRPLGDIFDKLVVSASYSWLVAAGHLVPARVYRPRKSLGNDLAHDPVEAWRKYSEGSRAFVFCARVRIAEDVAKRFRDSGVQAGVIHALTAKGERDDMLARFKNGTLRVLVNVGTLTEGVDVPEARTVILMRRFAFAGPYLQAVGRGLRPAKEKPDMILIDLVGTSIKHGLPTDDRTYSLKGRAISTASFHGSRLGRRDKFAQSLKEQDLELVSRGALPEGASVEVVPAVAVDDRDRKVEYKRLLGMAEKVGMQKGFAAARFHEKFGEWPRKEWA